MKNELKLVPVTNPEEGAKIGNYYVAGDCTVWDFRLTEGKAYLIEGVFDSENPENKGRCGMLTMEREFEIVNDYGDPSYMHVVADARVADPNEEDVTGKGCIMETDES